MPEARRAPIRSVRRWLAIATAIVVAVVVVAAREQLLAAWQSLDRVDPLILAALVPIFLLSLWTTAETLFGYLRGRGELRRLSPWAAMRLSLEFNFTNHLVPSGGAAGIAYTAWRLRDYGVAAGQATVAQLARFAVTFASFTLLLGVAIATLALGGRATPAMLWAAGLVAGLAIAAIALGVLLLGRRRRAHRVAGGIARLGNALARPFTRRRLDPAPLIRLGDAMHLETRSILDRPRRLWRPFLWSFAVNLLDASLCWVAIAAFGELADPAVVFVAYGVATVASMIAVTPNGAGPYEIALIGTLVAGGTAAAPAIAGVVLMRAFLLVGTIAAGWPLYHRSVARRPIAAASTAGECAKC